MRTTSHWRIVVAGGAAVLAVGLLLAFAGAAAQAATIYINATQPDDSGDGLTWGAAKQTLGAALSQAASGDEIWIAAGTYKPTTGTDRTISFVLKAGVGIYGGFVGTETARDQRDWVANVTTLSGDIGVVGDNSDNSYHVVTATGDMQNAVLDGFTVFGGNANWSSPNNLGGGAYFSSVSRLAVTNCTFSGNTTGNSGGGGGMYNTYSSPTVTSCTFSSNNASGNGGGICNTMSSPTVTNCIFSGNTASGDGGGMYNANPSGSGGGSPTVTNCSFSGNTAQQQGGGMCNSYWSRPTVTNCTFTNNTATCGGGMCNDKCSLPAVTNCAFSNNTANGGFGGGGMYNTNPGSPLTVTNCTFNGNTAKNGSNGGGMCNANFQISPSPNVTNCTFRNNTANQGGGMGNVNSPTAVTNCIFNGNTANQGGGMSNNESNVDPAARNSGFPAVTNCTFSNNIANNAGGGMYNDTSSPVVKNSILCGDTASNEISTVGISTPTVTYTCIAGGYAGAGNINADPLFVNPLGPDGIAGTEDDDLRLQSGSPCIDAGDNAAVPSGVTTDFAGNRRFDDDASVADTGVGTAPIVDMGAYERAFRPWAVADAATVLHGAAVTIPVLANDVTLDGGTLSITAVTQGTHGAVVINGDKVVYTANLSFVGTDVFTYTISDGVAPPDTGTVTVNVTNTAPTVTAAASPTSVVPDGNVVFAGNGSDPDGDALAYSWTFGDGATANEQNPTHAYASVGVYTATVTVTDSAGATGSASVTIQVSKAPTVRLTTSDVVAFGGNPFQLDASYSTDPENAIASYVWDFGDGTPPGSGQVISKVYDQPGEYTVTLTVTDAAGVSSTLTRVIQVLPADEMGLFNGFVDYKCRWDRNKTNKDSLSLTASVNVGDTVVGPGTPVALEIAGVRFSGTLDKKLHDYSNKDVKWQVKAGLRKQPYGAVLLKVKIKNASLGAGFNQAGAVVGADPKDTVSVDIPARIEIADRSFEVAVPSDFDFSSDGTKARGEGEF